jgi:hypothetical protein
MGVTTLPGPSRRVALTGYDRNHTSHTYNRSTAEAICQNISITYLACFQELLQRL